MSSDTCSLGLTIPTTHNYPAELQTSCSFAANLHINSLPIDTQRTANGKGTVFATPIMNSLMCQVHLQSTMCDSIDHSLLIAYSEQNRSLSVKVLNLIRFSMR